MNKKFKNIAITGINLASVDFTTGFGLKNRKIYTIKIKPNSTQQTPALTLRIAIISSERNNNGNFAYKAIYRGLSSVQAQRLTTIVADFALDVKPEAGIKIGGKSHE